MPRLRSLVSPMLTVRLSAAAMLGLTQLAGFSATSAFADAPATAPFLGSFIGAGSHANALYARFYRGGEQDDAEQDGTNSRRLFLYITSSLVCDGASAVATGTGVVNNDGTSMRMDFHTTCSTGRTITIPNVLLTAPDTDTIIAPADTPPVVFHRIPSAPHNDND